LSECHDWQFVIVLLFRRGSDAWPILVASCLESRRPCSMAPRSRPLAWGHMPRGCSGPAAHARERPHPYHLILEKCKYLGPANEYSPITLDLAAAQQEKVPLLTLDKKMYEAAKAKRNVQML